MHRRPSSSLVRVAEPANPPSRRGLRHHERPSGPRRLNGTSGAARRPAAPPRSLTAALPHRRAPPPPRSLRFLPAAADDGRAARRLQAAPSGQGRARGEEDARPPRARPAHTLPTPSKRAAPHPFARRNARDGPRAPVRSGTALAARIRCAVYAPPRFTSTNLTLYNALRHCTRGAPPALGHGYVTAARILCIIYKYFMCPVYFIPAGRLRALVPPARRPKRRPPFREARQARFRELPFLPVRFCSRAGPGGWNLFPGPSAGFCSRARPPHRPDRPGEHVPGQRSRAGRPDTLHLHYTQMLHIHPHIISYYPYIASF